MALAEARQGGDDARVEAARAAVREEDREVQAIRKRATDLVRATHDDRAFTDVNYVIPTFVLTELPIALWDERLSTAAVERELIAADMSRARRAAVIDQHAATFILQGALDRLRHLDAAGTSG